MVMGWRDGEVEFSWPGGEFTAWLVSLAGRTPELVAPSTSWPASVLLGAMAPWTTVVLLVSGLRQSGALDTRVLVTPGSRTSSEAPITISISQ